MRLRGAAHALIVCPVNILPMGENPILLGRVLGRMRLGVTTDIAGPNPHPVENHGAKPEQVIVTINSIFDSETDYRKTTCAP